MYCILYIGVASQETYAIYLKIRDKPFLNMWNDDKVHTSEGKFQSEGGLNINALFAIAFLTVGMERNYWECPYWYIKEYSTETVEDKVLLLLYNTVYKLYLYCVGNVPTTYTLKKF